MVRIAIVEDDMSCVETIQSYLRKFEEEKNVCFNVSVFENGLSFITNYNPVFDLVFMDIEMPHLNGMDTAKALYSLDKKVGIIFVTNMAQFAVKGYEVDALDFIVKPLKYFHFAVKLEKAVVRIEQRKEHEILIQDQSELTRMPLSKIYHIKVDKHYLIYTTESGIYKERGTMKECEEKLREFGFARCNNGCLVNLKHVKQIAQDVVHLGNEDLPVSRHKKKELVDSMMHYLRSS